MLKQMVFSDKKNKRSFIMTLPGRLQILTLYVQNCIDET